MDEFTLEQKAKCWDALSAYIKGVQVDPLYTPEAKEIAKSIEGITAIIERSIRSYGYIK